MDQLYNGALWTSMSQLSSRSPLGNDPNTIHIFTLYVRINIFLWRTYKFYQHEGPIALKYVLQATARHKHTMFSFISERCIEEHTLWEKRIFVWIFAYGINCSVKCAVGFTLFCLTIASTRDKASWEMINSCSWRIHKPAIIIARHEMFNWIIIKFHKYAY